MKYTLNTGNFLLELKPHIHMEDIAFPVNATLHVHVESDGFCATLAMDIDANDFRRFIAELTNLYDSLSGTALLEEPYGLHNLIEFSVEKGGYICVRGSLCQPHAAFMEQELRFANRFDQTYLKPFVRELQSFSINQHPAPLPPIPNESHGQAAQRHS